MIKEPPKFNVTVENVTSKADGSYDFDIWNIFKLPEENLLQDVYKQSLTSIKNHSSVDVTYAHDYFQLEYFKI